MDLKADLDNIVKDKNEHHTQVIQLRQEIMYLQSQLDVYTKKWKEDFADSFQGIQTVTNTFLTKIDNFFTNSVMFHLTCQKQEEQMNMIRSSCSSISRQDNGQCESENLKHSTTEKLVGSTEYEADFRTGQVQSRSRERGCREKQKTSEPPTAGADSQRAKQT